VRSLALCEWAVAHAGGLPSFQAVENERLQVVDILFVPFVELERGSETGVGEAVLDITDICNTGAFGPGSGRAYLGVSRGELSVSRVFRGGFLVIAICLCFSRRDWLCSLSSRISETYSPNAFESMFDLVCSSCCLKVWFSLLSVVLNLKI
jgi:hypothetical protein